MNAERLHAIARALQADLEQSDSLTLVSQLANALRRQVDNPAEPSHQQSVSTTLGQLQANLQNAASNDFSPSWNQTIEELGADQLLGDALADRLNDIFLRNQITVSVAQQEVTTIDSELRELSEAVNSLLDGMRRLGIGAEELDPGEVEVGVTIPRLIVRNELTELGEEFEQISRLLAPLVELATGSRPPLKVRAISSSDFSVWLDTLPEVGQVVAQSMAWLIAQYKTLLEIRQLKAEMERLNVPQEAIDATEAQATSQMATSIGQLVEQLVADFGQNLTDEGRQQEIKFELTQSMNGLARRIDLGFHVEVRAEPPELEVAAGDEEEEVPGPDPRFEAIRIAQPELAYVNLEGAPILALPEPEMPEPESEPPPKPKGKAKS